MMVRSRASLPGAAPARETLIALLLESNNWETGAKLNQKFTGREAIMMAEWLIAHGVSVGAALEAGPSPRDDDELGQFGEAVRAELLRAEKRWPDNEIFHRLAALSGEVGELAQGVIKNRPVRDLYAEAVQVAVCAFRATKALGVRGESLPPKYTLAEIEQAGNRFNVASAEVKLK